VALELALRSLGIGAGDDVIVPARTFVGTATAFVACGARPIVVDVDYSSQVLTVESIAAALTESTRAVIPVHLAGWPCDMAAIMEFAEQNELEVVEDCAQAHGAQIDGQAVGSFGDAAAFSFCTDKIITTCGEGGMLVCNDEDVWRWAWEYKDHGRGQEAMRQATAVGGYEFKWVVDHFGTNWRMTEIQAAVGRIQLTKLEDWIDSRNRNAAVLRSALQGLDGVETCAPPSNIRHAYYKYYFMIDFDRFGPEWSRGRLLEELNAMGVPALMGICPDISLEHAFDRFSESGRTPHPCAELLGSRSVVLPVHPTLHEADMIVFADGVRAVVERAVADNG
jgi:dTDP-4-amino-4,6-dideoxygalactose transaminase